MKKVISNPKGFTLVELMVVVAIIGILSAIAIPNFKKYQAKSKQSEAKIQLAAVYSVEIGANSDFDTFATCIGSLGFDTPPRGYYAVGFGADEATTRGYVVQRNNNVATSCSATAFFILPGTLLEAEKGNADVAATNLATYDTPPTEDTFKATAVGNISRDQAFDHWSINETKALVNELAGF